MHEENEAGGQGQIEDREQHKSYAHAQRQAQVAPQGSPLHYGSGVIVGPALRRPIAQKGEGRPELRVREDVKELDVEPVHVKPRQLGDAVALLEPENELITGVISRIELIEAKDERRSLLAVGEEQARLDVVGPPEIVAFVQCELPGLSRRRPVLHGGGEDAQVLVDLDFGVDVRALLGGRPRLHLENRHGNRIPASGSGQT
jgi:hypothetical protein